MPGPAPGGGEWVGEQAPARIRDAIVPLGVLLALGLGLRLIIAYVLLPGSGFGVDVSSFAGWASELARNGPWGLYDRPLFVDYTPGYLYVLWGLGLLADALSVPVADLLKFPPILADLGLALAIFALAADLGASRRRALAAAAVFLFVPVTWFDSAIWSQVDSVGTLFLVLAVRELWRGRSERAAILTTIAAIIKPQFGILIPLAAIVIIRRHWVERPDDGSRLGGGPIRIATTTIAGLLTAILVCLPFGLAIVPIPFLGIGLENSLVGQILQTAGGYPYVTVNAYNPWALVTVDGGGLAAAGTWICDAAVPETCTSWFSVGGVPAVAIGSVLIAAAIAGLMAVLWRRHDDRRAILVALAVMSIAFFVLPTRVHERYLYPFFALGAILLALRPRWAAVYAVLAAANFANLYGVLTLPFYENPGLGPMLGAFGGLGASLGDAVRSQAGVTLAAAAHTGGLLAAVAFLVRPMPGETDRESDGEPDTELADGELSEDGVTSDAGSENAVAGQRGGAAGPRDGAGRGTAADDGPSAPAAPAAAARDPERVTAVAARPADEEIPWPAPVAEPPAPFDRTASLAREGGGRFDRLDLWILVVLVVATLCLRTFRLDEPARMHFDEVYHARTAAEFLQDWRYGEPHGIYEWTHPHLAKYAMAGGLVLLGDDRVVATSDLGTPVRDAAIEPRWDDPAAAVGPGAVTRGGERLYVATGTSLDVHDLRTRERFASIPLAGAAAVAVDPAAHQVFVGTDAGEVLVLDTAVSAGDLRAAGAGDGGTAGGGAGDAGDAGDAGEGSSPTGLATPTSFASLGTPIERLWAPADGRYLVVGTADDGLVALDVATGAELSRTTVPGRAEVADAGQVDALVAAPSEIADPDAVAAELAMLLDGDAAAYRAQLASDEPEVTLTSEFGDAREAVDAAIADGRLPGIRVEGVPRLAVADAAGVTFLDPSTGRETDAVALDAPATGIVQVTGIDEPTLYAATGTELAVIPVPTAGEAPAVARTTPMPGPVERVTVDDASQLLHVLGRTPDGASSTVYVVEPRGDSVFADAVLPFAPSAWVTDTAPAHPATDRQQLLVFASDGAAAAVDIGHHAFAWRLPGVIAGVLMAALLYLLARLLFRRRSIAVLAGLFVLADGMLFAQSRIAMNDAYVALFIVAAVTVFAAAWTGAWRWRGAFWVGLPLVGLLLGLALASKWVGLYAIGGIGLLVLLRSALGRTLIVIGLAAIAASLGFIAISVGPDATNGGNVAFLLLMIGLTLVAAAVAVLHPVAWTVEEVRIAVVGPAALGALVALVAIPLGAGTTAIAAAVGLMALGGVAAGAFWGAGRFGFGPLAPPLPAEDPAVILPPADPAPVGWLRPGWLAGIPIAWAAVSLVVIPLGVYVLAYLPWVALGNQFVPGVPAGHDGQTLLDLTRSMYDYHNNLRATHAAASPWWAWPANLKPVWFYQDSFAGDTSGAIYDAGNLATWWLSLTAIAFVVWQAFRRRSLGLALVVIMLAALWLPWARIDRATFQYHYYTALPFALLALAYFAAEIWHGPSRRTWLLARGAAAAALLAPVAMWLFRGPLCAIVGVERANPGSEACSSAASISMSLSVQLAGILVVIGVTAGLLVWQLLALDRATRVPAIDAQDVAPRRRALAITAGLGLLALVATVLLLPQTPLVSSSSVPGELVALVLLPVLGPLAWISWRATSPRRFVIGIVLATAFVFVLFYPNVSGLPLPSGVFNWYQGFLPSWLYPFQFPVNTDPAVTVSLTSAWPMILFVSVLAAAGLVAYSASSWRLAFADRNAAAAGPDESPGDAEG